MTRTMIVGIGLFVLLGVFIVNMYGKRTRKAVEDTGSDTWIGKPAPEFIGGGQWLNSSPRKLSDYQGKIVLLEFWTYGCYNCRNTILTLNRWQKKYAGKDFVIVGIHTPEFEREKDIRNLRQQLVHLEIQYAVVTDNEYQTWEAYHQQYWPTVYLIDRKGVVRYVKIGEGDYDETERMIQSLIANK